MVRLPLGAASVLVLFPLELVLRLPRVAREFGLPTEIARQNTAYDWSVDSQCLPLPLAARSGRPPAWQPANHSARGSFTWGLYIGDSDSTWPAVLERQLNADAPGTPAEAINMPQRKWTTANEAEQLRRLGWQFQPELVVVQYFVNDAYPSEPDFKFAEPERTYLIPGPFWKGYVRSSSVSALVSLGVNGLLYGR
ncbi:MAG: SGNH/GDSL hydrolase family protein [Gemmatimonadales bacterium]|nr:SGNH/GDSL hydrolase family protein [Gemmatimonadales bacterium]